MKRSLLIKCALIGAVLPAFTGCVERQVVYRDSPPPPPAQVTVEDAPPPPPVQTEVVTVAPGPLNVWFWAPGGWEWRGRWVWGPGHWVARPRPGAVWVGSHWGYRGRHRVWIGGGWR